jgi:WhiB family redox-sensing transcriptional regulator
MVGSNNDGVSLWQESASCNSESSDLFFPERNAKPKEIRAAKAVCHSCPVVSECLEYALLYGVSGIWGGTTDKERKRKWSAVRLESLREDAKDSGTYNYTLKV